MHARRKNNRTGKSNAKDKCEVLRKKLHKKARVHQSEGNETTWQFEAHHSNLVPAFTPLPSTYFTWTPSFGRMNVRSNASETHSQPFSAQKTRESCSNQLQLASHLLCLFTQITACTPTPITVFASLQTTVAKHTTVQI